MLVSIAIKRSVRRQHVADFLGQDHRHKLQNFFAGITDQGQFVERSLRRGWVIGGELVFDGAEQRRFGEGFFLFLAVFVVVVHVQLSVAVKGVGRLQIKRICPHCLEWPVIACEQVRRLQVLRRALVIVMLSAISACCGITLTGVKPGKVLVMALYSTAQAYAVKGGR